MTTNGSRAPIDFDAFERELAEAASSELQKAPAAKSDPLAELARIVGQDDPFRALLEGRDGQSAEPKATRIEPSFQDVFAQMHGAPPQPERSPADAFDHYLASIEQSDPAAEGHYQDPAAFESDDRDYSNAATQRPHKRRKLVQVGAGLGVLLVCVTGAFAWKGLSGHGSSGEPVTVLADKTPLKVAPEKADGVEIPDQNKQIYDRTAKDGQIKVVNREEQPLDVAQAARAASGRDAVGQGGITPGGGLLTESLGEPRKIRTVAVKPDTPPPPMPQREAQAQPAPQAQSQPEVRVARPSPIPTMTMPDGDVAAAQAAPQSKPSRSLASTSTPAKPAQSPTQVADAGASLPAAAPASAARKAPQRVAAIAPETTASTSATDNPDAASTPSSAASDSPVGGFSVQLGVRSSEADAHAAFKQMQAKYSQLSGKPELIRQAEVNGQSLYRVRVGPLAKAEATSLCTALKGAGGQCFVAKN